MKNILKISAYCFVAVLIFLFAGCSYIAPWDSDEELVPISSIGILPAHTTRLQPTETGTAAELEAGVETVNSILADYFKAYQDVSLISQSKLEGLSSAKSENSLSLAREAGYQLHYDAVLITSVKRYKERNGSEFAVMEPASVAFSLKLLAVESGRIIWNADFDQTQQPLLENILPKTRSTGSGFRWLTAAELTSAGLTRKLNNSPYLKRD